MERLNIKELQNYRWASYIFDTRYYSDETGYINVYNAAFDIIDKLRWKN